MKTAANITITDDQERHFQLLTRWKFAVFRLYYTISFQVAQKGQLIINTTALQMTSSFFFKTFCAGASANN